MNLDGFHGVIGATRVKATVLSKPGTKEILVNLDQTNQQHTHRWSRLMVIQWVMSEAYRTALVTSFARERHMTTMSIPDRSAR